MEDYAKIYLKFAWVPKIHLFQSTTSVFVYEIVYEGT